MKYDRLNFLYKLECWLDSIEDMHLVTGHQVLRFKVPKEMFDHMTALVTETAYLGWKQKEISLVFTRPWATLYVTVDEEA